MKFAPVHKFAILTVLTFLVFFSVGRVFFDKRPPIDGRIDYFLMGLENPKLPYHMNFERLHVNHEFLRIKIVNSTSTLRDVCYNILPDGLKIVDSCKEDLTVVLDEHAAVSLITMSYYPQNTLLSEFIFGHVKVSGLKFNDILAILK